MTVIAATDGAVEDSGSRINLPKNETKSEQSSNDVRRKRRRPIKSEGCAPEHADGGCRKSPPAPVVLQFDDNTESPPRRKRRRFISHEEVLDRVQKLQPLPLAMPVPSAPSLPPAPAVKRRCKQRRA
ncbi:MAG: hypothetical protein MHM6MM_009095, partial [Cercozoa sp. M6MM]